MHNGKESYHVSVRHGHRPNQVSCGAPARGRASKLLPTAARMTRGNRSALAEGLNFLAYGTYADRRPVRAHSVSPQARRPAERPRTSGPAPGRSEPGQRWSIADWCPGPGPRIRHASPLGPFRALLPAPLAPGPGPSPARGSFPGSYRPVGCVRGRGRDTDGARGRGRGTDGARGHCRGRLSAHGRGARGAPTTYYRSERTLNMNAEKTCIVHRIAYVQNVFGRD